MNEQGEKTRSKKGNFISLVPSLVSFAVLAPVALVIGVIYVAVRVIHPASGLLVAAIGVVLGAIGAVYNTLLYDLLRSWGILNGKNNTCVICGEAVKGKEKVDLFRCCVRWVHSSCHELDALKQKERLEEQLSKGIAVKIKLT